jgi:O-antigen/teichoic acid export membrane protein
VSPLWPAYGEAQARRDLPWIRRTLRRSLLLAAAVSVPAALLLALVHRPVIRLWVGPQIQPTFWLIIGIAAWTVMGSIGNALAMFLNGLHVFRFQVIIGLSMAIANLALSIWLARTIGLPGVIWGTVISYGLLTIIPCWFYIPRMLDRLAKDPAQWKVL